MAFAKSVEARMTKALDGALERQKLCGLANPKDTMIQCPPLHIHVPVPAGSFGKKPANLQIDATMLLRILTFVVEGEVVEGLFEGKNELRKDVSKGFSKMRRVCQAFYFTMLAHWPLLQMEFIKQIQLFIIRKPLPGSSSPSFQNILEAIHPVKNHVWNTQSVRRNQHRDAIVRATRESIFHTIRSRLTLHLRYHCAPFLMMMFSNDMMLLENVDLQHMKGIPTLSGFASFIDPSFGLRVATSFTEKKSMTEIISLFFKEQAPFWTMLSTDPDTWTMVSAAASAAEQAVAEEKRVAAEKKAMKSEEDENEDEEGEGEGESEGEGEGQAVAGELRKDLEFYLQEEYRTLISTIKGNMHSKMGHLVCAPQDLFQDKWPDYWIDYSPIDGSTMSLKNYMSNFSPPPIRKCQFRTANGWVTFIAHMILPMRYLTSVNQDTLTQDHRFITMNITTGMLTQSSTYDSLWDVDISTTNGPINVNFALHPHEQMSRDMFRKWADVLMGHHPKLEHVYQLPLFRNAVNVQESIRKILPPILFNIVGYQEQCWDDSALAVDWGEGVTVMKWDDSDELEIKFSDSFMSDFDTGTRDQWASSRYFSLTPIDGDCDDVLKTRADWYYPSTFMKWTTTTNYQEVEPLINAFFKDPRHKFKTARTLNNIPKKKISKTISKMPKSTGPPLQNEPPMYIMYFNGVKITNMK